MDRNNKHGDSFLPLSGKDTENRTFRLTTRIHFYTIKWTCATICLVKECCDFVFLLTFSQKEQCHRVLEMWAFILILFQSLIFSAICCILALIIGPRQFGLWTFCSCLFCRFCVQTTFEGTHGMHWLAFSLDHEP